MHDSRLRELDLVALRQDLSRYGLVAGDVGTIVMVYRGGEAYEVEFVAADGHTVAVETLSAGSIEPLFGRGILHMRQLAQT
ncbi:MAG: DUF4926 domain-containing protein [Chloroflexota bacterium]|nr:DUF4926 domain-containing protein [Chloroflexota bacterium]